MPRGADHGAPLVSVVVPAYNAERFLGEAILSVLAQTHQAFELIVVDDGSTDRTLEIARSFVDPRVRVLTGANRGRAHARNVGVAASGPSDYLAFLDADDVWDPDKLTVQLTWITTYPDVLAVGTFMRYTSATGRTLGETGQEVDDAARARIARGELAPFPISSCLLVRRSAFDTIGGFDASLSEAEDLEFLAQLARRGAVACVPRVLGSYRIHAESAMARRRALVKQYARYVQRRLRARDRGGDLSWSEYAAAYRRTFAERWQDRAEEWYRSAALWHAEGRTLRAARFAALAVLAAPHNAFRRLWRQRPRGFTHLLPRMKRARWT